MAVIVMDIVNVNVVSGLTPQPPLQRRGGAVLSLIMSTTIIKFVYTRILIMNNETNLLATAKSSPIYIGNLHKCRRDVCIHSKKCVSIASPL